jgi:hypothetical protein
MDKGFARYRSLARNDMRNKPLAASPGRRDWVHAMLGQAPSIEATASPTTNTNSQNPYA